MGTFEKWLVAVMDRHDDRRLNAFIVNACDAVHARSEWEYATSHHDRALQHRALKHWECFVSATREHRRRVAAADQFRYQWGLRRVWARWEQRIVYDRQMEVKWRLAEAHHERVLVHRYLSALATYCTNINNFRAAFLAFRHHQAVSAFRSYFLVWKSRAVQYSHKLQLANYVVDSRLIETTKQAFRAWRLFIADKRQTDSYVQQALAVRQQFLTQFAVRSLYEVGERICRERERAVVWDSEREKRLAFKYGYRWRKFKKRREVKAGVDLDLERSLVIENSKVWDGICFAPRPVPRKPEFLFDPESNLFKPLAADFCTRLIADGCPDRRSEYDRLVKGADVVSDVNTPTFNIPLDSIATTSTSISATMNTQMKDESQPLSKPTDQAHNLTKLSPTEPYTSMPLRIEHHHEIETIKTDLLEYHKLFQIYYQNKKRLADLQSQLDTYQTTFLSHTLPFDLKEVLVNMQVVSAAVSEFEERRLFVLEHVRVIRERLDLLLRD
ncbi:hypothetical protein HDV02_003447 [Globomyces sp. JEL0801]|nr:hypothetical protein HDV02_003447 [Globomyces sp. JEL0801]